MTTDHATNEAPATEPKKRQKKRWNNPTELEAAIDKARKQEGELRREAEIMDDFAKIIAQKFPGWNGYKHTKGFMEYRELAEIARRHAKRLAAQCDGFKKTLAASKTGTLEGLVPDSTVVTQR